MTQKLKLIFFIFVLFFLAPVPALAQEHFSIGSTVTYNADASGTTEVFHEISITNNTSHYQATSYVLDLKNITPIDPKAYSGEHNYKIETTKDGEDASLRIEFDDIVAGKGAKRQFTVSYKNEKTALRKGEVWEVAIPKTNISGDFSSYEIRLKVPEEWGNVAYMAPAPVKQTKKDGTNEFVFDKESLLKSGISAGFGQFQVFDIKLLYHLENPLRQPSEIEIAIPPDTETQKVYYQSITPQPIMVREDEDGNWLARFALERRQQVDVELTASIQIYPTPSLVEEQEYFYTKYTKATKYWQADNARIQELSQRLDGPKEIYDFVTKNLTYNYDRLKPNVERKGALKAIEEPKNAICTGFTDLFIALARAKGIPAREINGFAYTKNPEIEPLSLVADVLHAWPQYWDEDKNTWVQVDPTWGSTTGGVDFFNKLDLNHITFVIHGISDSEPYPPGSYKLGPNPQKDVFVNFGQLPQKRESNIDISYEKLNKYNILNTTYKITLTNKGPVAVYDLTPQTQLDNLVINHHKLEKLLPYSSYSYNLDVKNGILGINSPKVVRIKADGEEEFLPTQKYETITYQLISLSVILILVALLLVAKTGKISIRKFIHKQRAKIKEKKSDKTKREKSA